MFGLWEPFVLIGGLAFWILFGIWSVAMVWSIEQENTTSSAFLSIAAFLFFFIATPFNPLMFALNQPLTVIFYVGLYFVGGSVWSFAKWWFYAKRRLHEATELRLLFNEHYPTPAEKASQNFNKWILTRREYRDAHYPPQVKSHKSDLLYWATYWPWSAFWTLLNDPIRYVWRFVYNTFGRALQTMTDSMFKDV